MAAMKLLEADMADPKQHDLSYRFWRRQHLWNSRLCSASFTRLSLGVEILLVWLNYRCFFQWPGALNTDGMLKSCVQGRIRFYRPATGKVHQLISAPLLTDALRRSDFLRYLIF